MGDFPFTLTGANDQQRESREWSYGPGQETANRVYITDDFSDPEAARSQLAGKGLIYGAAHPNLTGLFLISAKCEPHTHGTVKVTLDYGKLGDPREDQYGEVWEWNLATEQTNITAVDDPAKQVSYPSWADAGTAIGVDGDTVEGVDVYRPAGSLRVTKRIPVANIASWRTNILAALCTTNSEAWQNFAAGEVLFLGGDISPLAGGKHALVTMNFLFAKNREAFNVTTRTGTQSIKPTAWQHVWFRHVEVFSGADEKRTKEVVIESVHIATIYESASFATFNLGTGTPD